MPNPPPMVGQLPHRRAGLLLPQWHHILAPRVEDTGAPVVGAGGASKEDTRVPPLQCLGDVALLVQNSRPEGPWRAHDQATPSACWWWVCNRPFQGAASSSWRCRTLRHSPEIQTKRVLRFYGRKAYVQTSKGGGKGRL